MSRYNRINAIIELLRQGPQTVRSLGEHLGKNISERQIRSDIELIRESGYGDRPDFEKTGRANKKTWQIQLTAYERNTQRLSQSILPRVFASKRQQFIDRVDRELSTGSYPSIESTHFYEAEAYEPSDQGLETVIQAIDTCRMLIIYDLVGDATSVTKLIQFPLTVLPVKIIYHRGCFYLAAIADQTQKVLTFQIDHMKVEETDATFDRAPLISLVENDLRNRFGVTQNINEQTYTIELRFSSITGEFVRNQFWHDDLAEPVRCGDDWLFTFSCGINRELVGWIFQWMSNVRVVGPPILKELYDEQLKRMLDVTARQPDEPLPYTNAFAPH